MATKKAAKKMEGPNVPARKRLASQIAHLRMYHGLLSPSDLVRAYHLTREEAETALYGQSAFFGSLGKTVTQFEKRVLKALRKKEWFSAPDPKAIPGAERLYGRYVWLLQHGEGDTAEAKYLEKQLTAIGFNGWGLIIDAWPAAKRYYDVAGSVVGSASVRKHESGKNPMIYTIRNASKKVVAKIIEGKAGEKIRVTSYDDLGRAHTHSEKSLFDAAAYVGGRGATPSGGWEDLDPSSRLLLQRWSVARHESGKNPLTLGERAKMRLGVLSPAAARSANSREKDLLREHSSEVQKLIESVDACRKCDHSAEKKAKKHIQKAKDILAGLEKLAKYRSDPDVAEASMKPLRKRVFDAETRLAGRNPGAIVSRERSSSSNGGGGGGGGGRRPKDYTEAEFHEAEGNPRVSRSHPRRREVTVFKAPSPSRATMVAARLRKAGHDSGVIGGYGGRTVVVDTPAGRRVGGKTLREADAALRVKIRALVGKK